MHRTLVNVNNINLQTKKLAFVKRGKEGSNLSQFRFRQLIWLKS